MKLIGYARVSSESQEENTSLQNKSEKLNHIAKQCPMN